MLQISNRSSIEIACTFLLGSGLIGTAMAQGHDALREPVNHWYQALENNDADMLDAILGAKAVIELRDLGISQTRKEFLDSLDQWAELNGGATLLTREISDDGETIVTEVCYRFDANEVLNRESFTIEQGLITSSIQEQLSENCAGFPGRE